MYTWDESEEYESIIWKSAVVGINESFIKLGSQLTENALPFRIRNLISVIVPEMTINFYAYGDSCLDHFYFVFDAGRI